MISGILWFAEQWHMVLYVYLKANSLLTSYCDPLSIDAVCDVPTHTSKMLEQELNYTYTIQNTTSSTKHLP